MKELNCTICNTRFSAYDSQIKNGKKTCSIKCSYEQRGIDKSANLFGKKMGMLTILNRVPNIYKCKKVCWEAKCDCGEKTIITTGDFLRKDKRRKKSCGCLTRLKGNSSPHWKGKYGVSKTYWSGLLYSVKLKGYDFDLDMKYLRELFDKQNGSCALSGLAIVLNENASLDRIDSGIGYLKSNVQWVHKDVNRMKSDFKQDYFVLICNKIAKNYEK